MLLRVVEGVLIAYLILISLRILLSWFRASVYGRPWELLVQATEPYLAVFRRLAFLRRGMFDFSPLAAILVLVIALDLVGAIRAAGRITLGMFLGVVVRALWSGLAFLMFFFLILTIVRAVMLTFQRYGESPLSQAVGHMAEPAVALVRRVLPLRRPLPEVQYVYLTVLILFLVRLLGGLLFGAIIRFFYTLPF